MRHFPASAWARYSIALAAFLVSFFLREALAPWLSSDRGIIVFLPAILFVTFCAGLGPGLLTTVLSGIALWYVFMPPYHSFAFSLDTAVGLATFTFGSVAGVTLVHLLQIATARAKTEQERSAALAASVTADLVGMTQLNNLSSLLVREGKDLKTCLNHVLETAIAITSADKGNVQLFDGNAVALTIATVFGSISAPPAPCRTRQASSTANAGARPPAAEAAVNTTDPMMKTRLRPNMSPRRPPSTSKPASGSRLAFLTHCTCWDPTWKSWMMFGSASGTAV